MITLGSSYWRVIHTSHKGRGVFATKIIPPGTVIGDYLGRIISPEDDSDEQGLYGMSWSHRFVILPDKKGIGLHLINHSCMANCCLYPYEGHMIFVSLRKIFPGEELSVSYMVEPGEDPKGLYRCFCHTPRCTGTMMTTRKHAHAFWDEFVRPKQGKFADTPPVPIGEKLTVLPSYPKQVADNPVYDLYGNADIPPTVYPGKTPLSVQDVRSRIRRTGVCIQDTVRKIRILGVREGKII